MAVTRVQLEIGEIVLYGVAPADRHRVADGLRVQLQQALAAPGVLGALAREGAALDRLVLPAIRGNRRGDRLGAALADALVAGFSRMGAPDDVQPSQAAANAASAPRAAAGPAAAAPEDG